MKTLLLGDTAPVYNTKELFRAKETEKLFTNVIPYMKAADYCFVNLECALTETDGKIKKFGPNLAAPLETAEVLKELGVDLCGLSNNHTFDLGVPGIKDTLAALDKAGIAYTGWGKNYEDSRKDYILEKDGEKIAFITVCEHEYSYALENRMGARPYDEYDTMEDIRKAKQDADRVIVIYHGGKEYCRYPSPRLLRLCRAMARNGADVVICQHSHCIGCYEEYEGCHILYGQGNFHFVNKNSTEEGWFTSLGVEYDTKTHAIEFTPIRALENGISLAEGEDAKEIMAAFEARNAELKNGEWEKGWRAFCEERAKGYYEALFHACNPNSTQEQRDVFGHYLDCEAHTDVWRELFKTYNHTNCLGEE